ncbi:MAG: ATP-binding protein [Campylobacterales bacterium]|nr:ATP-binding protein [Campylobacterales bacterium]
MTFLINKFEQTKNVFIDDNTPYINLGQSSFAYNKLKSVIENKIPLSMIYGKPGTGKTMLLRKIYSELKDKEKINLILTPFQNEKDFLQTFYKILFNTDSNIEVESIMSKTIELLNSSEIDYYIFLLDETQQYSESILDIIRVLSDTKKIIFILSLHKLNSNEKFELAHFKSRVWEKIELQNIDFSDFKTYFQKKMLQNSLSEIISIFNDSSLKKIYNYTNGNLREINKFFYKIFDIAIYYENKNSSMVNTKNFRAMFLEMSAIDLGYIHV